MSKIRAFFGGMEIPIPPIEGLLALPGDGDPIRVVGRLQSTQGGVGFNWQANFGLPTEARYEPRVDLEFTGGPGIYALGWRAPATLSGTWAFRDVQSLSWGGIFCDAPATVWGAEVRDLTFRAWREEVINTAKADIAAWPRARVAQGHLQADWLPYDGSLEGWVGSRFAPPAGGDATGHLTGVHHPARPVILFDHAVFVQAVIGLDNYRLVQVMGGDMVLSPSHPLNPLPLWEGLWLLSHPFPERAD